MPVPKGVGLRIRRDGAPGLEDVKELGAQAVELIPTGLTTSMFDVTTRNDWWLRGRRAS